MAALLLALVATIAVWQLRAGDPPPGTPHPGERDGQAQLIHRAGVLKNRGTGDQHLWPLYATPEARMNYFEVTSRSGLHFHPDADHRLYVLEGSVVVIAGSTTNTAITGDLIVIPRGVRHAYDVVKPGDKALLLTFDAPPYDPRKTVNVAPPAK